MTAVGPKVSRVTVGKRVALIPGVFCAALEVDPACGPCRAGLYALCRSRQEPQAGLLGGGWSESFVRHESQLFPISEELTDEAAALVEPLASSLHAVLRRLPNDGDRVLVVGGGMIGLGIVAALRALRRKLDVIVVARYPFQAERATRLGARRVVGGDGADLYEELAREAGTCVVGGTRNRYLSDGFDAVYDAVGSAASLQDGLRWVRPRGYVVLVGIDLYPGVLDRAPVWRREIDVVGATGHGTEDFEGTRQTTFERIDAWLRSGRLDASGLVTHRFALEEYREALRAACAKARSRAVRVVFAPR